MKKDIDSSIAGPVRELQIVLAIIAILIFIAMFVGWLV